MGISEHVSQWAAGSDVSDCAVGGPLPPRGEATPCLVIAQAMESCEDDGRDYKGIVFYNHEPIAWCCLRKDEIESFTDWGNTALPGAQVVTVVEPLASINCPPPNPSLIARPRDELRRALRDELRRALRALAAVWLAQAA